jgi:hypothetical protein
MMRCRGGLLVLVTAVCSPLIVASPALADGAGFTASPSQNLPPVVRSSLKLERVLSRSTGEELVKLRCAMGSGGCHTTLTLSTAGRHGPRVLLGTKTTTVAAGGTRTLTVKMGRFGRALLAKRGKLSVRLEILLSLARVRSVVATRRLVVMAPNPILAVTGIDAANYAKRFIGAPYLYGGNGPTTFDCSGFTAYVFAHFGYHLARQAYYQMNQGRPVRGPLKVGDLIFWNGGGHVGIYTGNGTFISATTARGIWIYSLQLWGQTQSYSTARRIVGRPTAG